MRRVSSKRSMVAEEDDEWSPGAGVEDFMGPHEQVIEWTRVAGKMIYSFIAIKNTCERTFTCIIMRMRIPRTCTTRNSQYA